VAKGAAAAVAIGTSFTPVVAVV
jgi:hypothetical protein